MVERVSVLVGADELQFETGRIAKQAHGSVICQSGDTMVLSAVTIAPEAREETDFFPMTVDYREKFYAVGQIPGNFFRRESRPSEREILVCRMTDRPLRPLFPKRFFNEVMICQTVFSADNIRNPDVLSINAASAALHISKAPLVEPIGAVRVGYLNGALVVNPHMDEMDSSSLDIIVAGTRDSICMVEGQAHELSEALMVEALEFAHTHIRAIIGAIDELRSRAGVEKMVVPEAVVDPAIVADVESLAAARFKEAFGIREKQARLDALDAVKAETQQALQERYGEEQFAACAAQVAEALSDLKKNIMRRAVVETNVRMDGRRLDQIRNITIEVGILPRVHGSALFTRGETQAIVATTLGTSRDEMRLDELTGDEFRRFFLHYNFPSWSVGEVRRISGPGRREVGHGKLAERALECMLPFVHPERYDEGDEVNFPYTVRIVSDITESNGSSSMATVCGGSLSLMDAGIPIKSPVAGIAMGLIKEGDEVRILSDILGDEDHLGDMDFKVCGTTKGITAFQMDTKVKGLSREVMERALEQARQGREFILGEMNKVLDRPRPDISPYAPRIFTIKIHPDKIREVIGPGNKVIRRSGGNGRRDRDRRRRHRQYRGDEQGSRRCGHRIDPGDRGRRRGRQDLQGPDYAHHEFRRLLHRRGQQGRHDSHLRAGRLPGQQRHGCRQHRRRSEHQGDRDRPDGPGKPVEDRGGPRTGPGAAAPGRLPGTGRAAATGVTGEATAATGAMTVTDGMTGAAITGSGETGTVTATGNGSKYGTIERVAAAVAAT